MPRRKKKVEPADPDRRCKDCPDDKHRPAPYKVRGGWVCATHNRLRRKKSNQQSRNSHLVRTYSITEADYEEVLASQGGVCFICGPITGRNGTSKKLSVDHDHKCCNGPKSCGRCVRAVLCTNCNRYILGHLRDDVEALKRAIEVIETHPAQKVLRRDEST